MLIVKLNKAGFEYDIHSLVKAFYPEEDVKVLTPDFVCKEKELLQKTPDITISFNEDEVILKARKEYRINLKKDQTTHKDDFKGFLYQCLVSETGKTLPWGNLTGIRPTKIAMGMLDKKKTEAEIKGYLKEKHFVSDTKAELGIQIAKKEKKLLELLHCKEGYSLYIGIPFCPTTCIYCSFTSYPICTWKNKIEQYLEALFLELDYVARVYKDKPLDSVYIGGGTPTTLEASELDKLLSKVESTFNFGNVKEFTVEAGRADSITLEKLQVLKKHKVTRISINPQTMKEETLKLIGRRHTVEQVKEAYEMARKEGFDNINMDIILGLPGEDEEDVSKTISEIKKLNPDSLTVHSLAIKRAGHLHEWIEKNGIETLKNTERTMEIASCGARSMDMEPYYLYRQKNMSGNFENVGYAKEGKEGIYNILIMEEKQTIVACGAGTITKMVYQDGRIERCDNVKDVSLYIEKIHEMIERKQKLFSFSIGRDCDRIT